MKYVGHLLPLSLSLVHARAHAHTRREPHPYLRPRLEPFREHYRRTIRCQQFPSNKAFTDWFFRQVRQVTITCQPVSRSKSPADSAQPTGRIACCIDPPRRTPLLLHHQLSPPPHPREENTSKESAGYSRLPHLVHSWFISFKRSAPGSDKRIKFVQLHIDSLYV